MTTIKELRELEKKATKGPWAWRWPSGSPNCPELVHPKSGLLLVMGARRSGMVGATPTFAERTDSLGGIMHSADKWMPTRAPMRPDYQTPTNPDMQMLAAARNALPALLDIAEKASEAVEAGAVDEIYLTLLRDALARLAEGEA